jgi:hypothetical protein
MRRAPTSGQQPRTAWCAALVRAWQIGCLCLGLLAAALPAHAQGVELGTLELRADEGTLALEFSARLTLSRAIEDALRRGVPMYFDVEATLFRSRWYWRDERVARATRSWRLSYQPLTASWRVSQGGLQQSYGTLEEALLPITRNARWKIADAAQIDPDDSHHVEFSWRLDTSQLPRPLQIGIGGQAEWQLVVERTLQLD